MNIFKKIYCRSFQTVFKIALPFLPYRKPKIVSALSDIPSVLNKKKKVCPVIITDPGIAKLGILSMLTDVFDNAGIEYHVYDKTVANPTTETVEEALAIYKDNKCDCIIGFGGFGESGMGSYHGKAGFNTFSHYKSIVDKKCWLDLPMRYQPYTKLNDKLIHMFLK